MILYALRTYLLAQPAIAASLGTRIYPRRFPAEPVLPAVVMHRIEETRDRVMSAAHALITTDLRIDIYATTDYQARTIAGQIDTALDGYAGAMGSLTVGVAYVEALRDLVDSGYLEELEEYAISMDVNLTWR